MKSNSDVNKAFNIFLDTFSDLYDTNYPFISHTNNTNKKITITALYGFIIKSKILLKKTNFKNTIRIDIRDIETR